MFIYRIHNITTDKSYVGRTSARYICNRWCAHKYQLKKNTHDNKYLQEEWDRYGPDAFKVEILAEPSSLEELGSLEAHWIAKLGSAQRDRGYNIELGGLVKKTMPETKAKQSKARIGFKCSPESIERMRAAKKQQAVSPKAIEAMRQSRLGSKVSEATKKKISEAQKGEKGNNWKKPMPEETRKKISAKLKGRIQKPITEETRRKLSESHKGQVSYWRGKKRSPESVEKTSKSLKGHTPWNKGMTLSPERRKRMAEAQQKRAAHVRAQKEILSQN